MVPLIAGSRVRENEIFRSETPEHPPAEFYSNRRAV